MNSKRIVLITGATSGIGEATARLLAANNFKLILVGRRNDRLTKLTGELSQVTEVIALNFDVRDRSQTAQSIGSLPEEWKNIDVLVNNAG
ncbi:MAG: SDR family NAD(P)-dependent oxidoreductase, partial [Cytophagales bacterium]|nr:SDR family NAD(P)-dependent oxidoreductase [Cytophagales bacterium]